MKLEPSALDEYLARTARDAAPAMWAEERDRITAVYDQRMRSGEEPIANTAAWLLASRGARRRMFGLQP